MTQQQHVTRLLARMHHHALLLLLLLQSVLPAGSGQQHLATAFSAPRAPTALVVICQLKIAPQA
jgi:hypothetical protein